jgi:hypothetical protein
MLSLLDRFRSSPLISAVGAQVIGVCFVLIIKTIIPEFGYYPWMLAAVQGAAAAIASHHLGAPSWWQLIHLGFVPGLLFAGQFSIPPWIWLASFGLMYAIFGRTDRSRVPLYLTNRMTGDAIAAHLPKRPCFVVDIGCGDGGLIRQLAKLRPESEFVGIEHAVLTCFWAKLRSRHLPNVHIRMGDFWAMPLAPYDVAYAFLSPAPMADLWRKACADMQPNTLLISNSFPIPDANPEQTLHVEDRRQSALYLYRLPDEDALSPSVD